MQNNLDKYTLELKNRLDKSYLSPLFIRLANLLYINDKFEECIEVCKTGLVIYPDYFTAKLILLKAFLKAGYLNEAEVLFNEIKNKIPDSEMYLKLKENIENLKSISGQEKIYYTKSHKNKYDYKLFDKNFRIQEKLFQEFEINSFLNGKSSEDAVDKSEFENFLSLYNSFHFEKESAGKKAYKSSLLKKPNETSGAGDLLGKVKIVTETLADLYAEQGNFKEAFEAYNLLLRAGTPNKKRIEDKIYELERNMFRKDGI